MLKQVASVCDPSGGVFGHITLRVDVVKLALQSAVRLYNPKIYILGKKPTEGTSLNYDLTVGVHKFGRNREFPKSRRVLAFCSKCSWWCRLQQLVDPSLEPAPPASHSTIRCV